MMYAHLPRFAGLWAALRLPVAALCCCLVVMLPAGAFAARSATMPLGAHEKPIRPNGQAAPPAPTHKTAKGQSGIGGFCANPFDLEHKKPEARKAAEKKAQDKKKADKSRLIYGKTEDSVKPLSIGGSDKVTVGGKGGEAAKSPLSRRKGVFPGAENTLSQMDDEAAPEVSLQYKMNRNATTSLVVNPQDEASPLPRPAEPNHSVNSAGVYMDVDVAPDVKMRIGGEYCDINDPRASGSDSSRGASVGFEWSF